MVGYLDKNPFRFWSQAIYENMFQVEQKVKCKNSNHEELEDNICEFFFLFLNVKGNSKGKDT